MAAAPAPVGGRAGLGGLGGLLTGEVVTSELGTYGGLRLRGRVRRQAVRVALGWRLRGTLVRLRPVGVEVSAAEGVAGVRLVPIAPAPDPFVQAFQRVAALWAASLVLRFVVARLVRKAGRQRPLTALV